LCRSYSIETMSRKSLIGRKTFQSTPGASTRPWEVLWTSLAGPSDAPWMLQNESRGRPFVLSRGWFRDASLGCPTGIPCRTIVRERIPRTSKYSVLGIVLGCIHGMSCGMSVGHPLQDLHRYENPNDILSPCPWDVLWTSPAVPPSTSSDF